jgi:hypothetical protein
MWYGEKEPKVLPNQEGGLCELMEYIDHFWDESLLRLKEAVEEEERRNHAESRFSGLLFLESDMAFMSALG